MSSAIADQSSVKHRPAPLNSRKAFYRLYGDVVEKLNDAVSICVAGGKSQAAIARDADLDPATLSRILAGQAGTNLRSVACVLAATEHRFKIEIVSCKNLIREQEIKRLRMDSEVMIKLVVAKDGVWKKPSKVDSANRQEKQFSEKSLFSSVEKAFV